MCPLRGGQKLDNKESVVFYGSDVVFVFTLKFWQYSGLYFTVDVCKSANLSLVGAAL